jgi:hypothetical protein
LLFRNDIDSVELYPVRPTASPANGGYWDTVEGLNASFIKFGIGDPDGLPTGGTFSLKFTVGEDDEEFNDLAYNITAGTLQTALNAGALITAAGGVTVVLLATGNYEITFGSDGARTAFTSNPAGLSPECNVAVSTLIEGDGSTQCVQLVQLVQRPYVFVPTWTAIGPATATVTELRAGGIAAKGLYSIIIAPAPYSGTYSVKGSSPISFDQTNEATILEALGTGWGSAIASVGSLVIERAENGVYSLTDDDVDVSALVVYQGFRGKLAINSPSLYRRFLSEESGEITTNMQIRYDDGTYRETLYFGETTLTKDILSPGGIGPSSWNNFYLTSEQSDARYPIFLPTITSQSGDGLNSADSIQTTNIDAPRLFIFSTGGANAFEFWVLEASTNATVAGEWQRPIDFDASTNAKVFHRNAPA